MPSRHALVIGASSPIGQATCTAYLARGYRVTAQYFAGQQAATELTNLGAAAVFLDCTDLSAVAEFAEQVSPVDALQLLAATSDPMRLDAIDILRLRRSMDMTLANYVLIGALGPGMAERAWGRIVIGSSIGVRFGGGLDSFGYALAKHAAEFLPAQARAWAEHNVLTNVVRIGVSDTGHLERLGRDLAIRAQMIPQRRAAQPAEIADYLVWHGSESNTFVSGQVLAISGGE